MGINDYSDLTWNEFKALRIMAPQNCSATSSLKLKKEFLQSVVPQQFDWNSKGMVSPVKNQGHCGSCWTFSTIGSLEAHWNILGKGRNWTFSEQQLVDCAGAFDNHGCEGGLPSHAFEYIRHAKGIEGESTYFYTATDGVCKYNKSRAIGFVNYGSYNITARNQTQLKQRIYNAGPVSVTFQVVSDFRNYHDGVYVSTQCKNSQMDVNHAVLATGYGVDDGDNYWTIKNSWGQAWGNNGYFNIKRDVNMCGIAVCNSYPLVDKPRLDHFQSNLETA